jgi:predicted esterase
MEPGVINAVESIHKMIDEEVAAGVSADHIFLCGFSQGGRSTLSSLFLHQLWVGWLSRVITAAVAFLHRCIDISKCHAVS